MCYKNSDKGFNFGFRIKRTALFTNEEEEEEELTTSFPVCARRWREIPAWRCSPNRTCPWTERPSRASSASSRPCRGNRTRPSEYSTEMTFTRSTGKTPCSQRRRFSRQTASSSTWAQVLMSATRFWARRVRIRRPVRPSSAQFLSVCDGKRKRDSCAKRLNLGTVIKFHLKSHKNHYVYSIFHFRKCQSEVSNWSHCHVSQSCQSVKVGLT